MWVGGLVEPGTQGRLHGDVLWPGLEEKVGEKYRDRKAGIIWQDEQYCQGAETHGVCGGGGVESIREEYAVSGEEEPMGNS